MSSFTTGRRGHNVNMSQYLQTLNEIRNEPSPEDTTATLDDELAVFANTDFVDWDGPVGTAHHNSPAAAPTPASTSTTVSAATPMIKQAATPAPPNTDPLADLTTFDFNLDGYGFDFNPYTSSGVPAFTENLGALQPLQPTPNYPSHVQRGAFVPAGPPSGEKRKSEALPAPRQLSFEEQSRIAAEEDKRRRNTAASARFRVKKKAREQALEKSQKEYAEKILALEGRISTLETENKWLRELVMEKNGGSKETVSTLLDGQKEKESTKSS